MDSRSAKPRATTHGKPGPAHAARRARDEEGSREGFCGYLREARERASLSIEDISRVTRIPEHSLRRLEAGEFADLPGDVFVRGFLRSYARCVGLDADDVVRRYAECGGLAPAPVASDLARVAAEQAAAVAQLDDAGGEVVTRPTPIAAGTAPPPPAGRAPAAMGTPAAVGTPPPATAPAEPRAGNLAPAASPAKPAAGNLARPPTGQIERVEAADEPVRARGTDHGELRRATTADPVRRATTADPVRRASTADPVRRATTADPARAAGGSKQRRRERLARRRAPTVVPHARTPQPRGGHARHAASGPTASGTRRRVAEPRAAASSSDGRPSLRAWLLSRPLPVLLGAAVLVLVVVAILVMSHLLRQPAGGSAAPPAAGAPR